MEEWMYGCAVLNISIPKKQENLTEDLVFTKSINKNEKDKNKSNMKEMITLTLYMVALKVLDFIDNLKKDDSDER